jgi:uncharacterized protein (DUF924 family)
MAEARAVVAFWRQAGSALWFTKDEAFDRRFRDRFLPLYEAAARGELTEWLAAAEGALALVLLLDQFPRNAFRGTPQMYATDTLARQVAHTAIEAGHDRVGEAELSLFLYLPFAHSESLADQERSVALVQRLGRPNLSPRRKAPRHHPSLRPLPAPQLYHRAQHDRGGAAISRWRRLRRLSATTARLLRPT